VCREAIAAGATTVNLPDTVGYCLPDEHDAFLRRVQELCPELRNVVVSVHCHNDLGLAVANTLSGIRAGATQVECTVNGIGERAATPRWKKCHGAAGSAPTSCASRPA
jgi:2-isopropylmalate synthase